MLHVLSSAKMPEQEEEIIAPEKGESAPSSFGILRIERASAVLAAFSGSNHLVGNHQLGKHVIIPALPLFKIQERKVIYARELHYPISRFAVPCAVKLW